MCVFFGDREILAGNRYDRVCTCVEKLRSHDINAVLGDKSNFEHVGSSKGVTHPEFLVSIHRGLVDIVMANLSIHCHRHLARCSLKVLPGLDQFIIGAVARVRYGHLEREVVGFVIFHGAFDFGSFMFILIEALVRHSKASARRCNHDIIKRLGSLRPRYGKGHFRNLDKHRLHSERIVDFVKVLVPALECIPFAGRGGRSRGCGARGYKATLEEGVIVIDKLDKVIVDGLDFHRGGNRREGLVPTLKLEVLRITLVVRVRGRGCCGSVLGNKGSLELGIVEVKELHHVLDI